VRGLSLSGRASASAAGESGEIRRSCRALRPPRSARSTQQRDRLQVKLSMPLAYPSTLDRRHPASYVEGLWSPALLQSPKNSQAKAAVYSAANRRARKAQQDLSLSDGASSSVGLLQAGHHPSYGRFRLLYDEGDPLGSPSRRAAMRPKR
jgi:hypothetical protein